MDSQEDTYSKRREWNGVRAHAQSCSHLVDCGTAMISFATQPMITKNDEQCVIWQVRDCILHVLVELAKCSIDRRVRGRGCVRFMGIMIDEKGVDYKDISSSIISKERLQCVLDRLRVIMIHIKRVFDTMRCFKYIASEFSPHRIPCVNDSTINRERERDLFPF
mgnify:CR=1 FL=1